MQIIHAIINRTRACPERRSVRALRQALPVGDDEVMPIGELSKARTAIPAQSGPTKAVKVENERRRDGILIAGGHMDAIAPRALPLGLCRIHRKRLVRARSR